MRTSVKTLAVATLAVASFVVVPTASAETVTTTVNGGELTASTAATNGLGGVDTSVEDANSSGRYVVNVVDLRGTGAGWSVTQSVGNFTGGGDTIPAENLTVSSIEDASNAAADNKDEAALVQTGTATTLGLVAGTVSGDGEGAYDVPVNVDLKVPAFTKAGDYSANLTISTAPALVAGP